MNTELNNKERPVYTISVAAKLMGISVHTLRMYEREGLIIPFKKSSKQRLYSDGDICRVNCIRRAINEDKIGIEGIRRILALIPCWGLIKCTSNDRKNCEAYNSFSQPCWTIKHRNNTCKDRDCRECSVYQSFGDCSSIKEELKNLIT